MSSSTSHAPMPEVNLILLAKTTRKTLDRLASFSKIRSASSDPLPLLAKISRTIHHLIALVDASMLAAQRGYQLASDAMILCDPEEADWEADVSVDGLRGTSREGYEKAKSVMEGFRDVRQEVYKIAASTKDNNTVVLVPPDPFHVETMKIHLKDIGTDLVANLNLLSEFSRETTAVQEWWTYVKQDLDSETPTLLPSSPAPGIRSEGDLRRRADAAEKFDRWAQLKESFQQYYNIINAAQTRYPELLPSSSVAWKTVASPGSVEASSIGRSASQGFLGESRPASRSRTHAERHRLEFFRMFRLKRRTGRASRKQISEPALREKDVANTITRDKEAKEANHIARQGSRGSSHTAADTRPDHEEIPSSLWCWSGRTFLESMANYGHCGFFL
ncbi:hypothetical protein CVT26_009009 [Gymnopilus dilepis]|uniref:Uncharacterized protein n=1 Tax=Gymnopilus dilepis TaxID=231916 RepID=A0A409YR70_9AGAR|nr:hypothetical protein CVT26_009009 [Gymnopilus dilepis]